jgi:hypothetical protein
MQQTTPEVRADAGRSTRFSAPVRLTAYRIRSTRFAVAQNARRSDPRVRMTKYPGKCRVRWLNPSAGGAICPRRIEGSTTPAGEKPPRVPGTVLVWPLSSLPRSFEYGKREQRLTG